MKKSNEIGYSKSDAKVLDEIAEALETYLDSSRVLPNGTVYRIKLFVASVRGLNIEVYPKDHQFQPHFHVISIQRRMNARFDLVTIKYINCKSGHIRKSDERIIKDFFCKYPDELARLRSVHANMN